MIENLTAILGLASNGVGILKGATEVTQAIKGLVSKPEVDATATKKLVSDLLDRLVRLQTEQMTMQEELLKFQDEQKRRGRFQSQAHRYAMVKTELGSLVYSLKTDEARGEPPHDLCTTCFEDEVKSVLQPVNFNTLECPRCHATFLKPDGRQAAMMGTVSRSNRFEGF